MRTTQTEMDGSTSLHKITSQDLPELVFPVLDQGHLDSSFWQLGQIPFVTFRALNF